MRKTLVATQLNVKNFKSRKSPNFHQSLCRCGSSCVKIKLWMAKKVCDVIANILWRHWRLSHYVLGGFSKKWIWGLRMQKMVRETTNATNLKRNILHKKKLWESVKSVWKIYKLWKNMKTFEKVWVTSNLCTTTTLWDPKIVDAVEKWSICFKSSKLNHVKIVAIIKVLRMMIIFMVRCFAKYEAWSVSKVSNVSRLSCHNRIVLTQICNRK